MADPTATQQELSTLQSGADQALRDIQHALNNIAQGEHWVLGADLNRAFDANAALDRVNALQTAIDNGISFAISLLGDPDGATALKIAEHINSKLSAAGFGNTVQASVTDSTVSLHFSSSGTANASGISLATDLGLGSNLGFHTTGTINASAAYHFDLTVGVDGTTPLNYYLQTGGGPLLSVDLNASAPSFTGEATLGFLKFNAADHGSSINGHFSIAPTDPNGDGKIDATELATSTVFDSNTQLTGSATGNVHLHGGLLNPGLPGIDADLNASWTFGNDPSVALNNVTYDFGSFINNTIGPYIEKVNDVLKPLHQILAAFETDISPLDAFSSFFDRAGGVNKDGGDAPDGKVTLFDFIKMASPDTNLTSVVHLTDTIEKIIDWAGYIQGKNFGPDAYDLGSFKLPYVGGVLQLTPQVTAPQADLLSFLNDLTGGEATQKDSLGQTGIQILHDLFTDDGFQVPFITDPEQAFKFLLGQDADLLKLDLPAVSFAIGDGFDSNGNPKGHPVDIFSFSPFPGVDVKLQGDLAVALDMAFGLDKRGFFIDDQFNPLTNVDMPEAQIEAALQLTVGADVFGATIGGGGNIAADVKFDLNDTVNGSPADHRLYADEFAGALVHNPFQLFDVGGDVTAGFNAYVDVLGFNVWRYNSPRIVLADFGNFPTTDPNAPPPEPHLGTITVSSGSAPLQLSVGTHAGDREIADHADDSETFSIKPDGTDPSMVDVNFGGTDSAASDTDDNAPITIHTSKYTLASIDSIVGDAGVGDDQITVDSSIHAGVTLDGGPGIDTLDGGGGDDVLHGGDDPDPVHFGRDYLSGHGGNDQLFGDNGDDVLEGGAGADHIDGGSGTDIATYQHASRSLTIDLSDSTNNTGDAAGDTFVSIEVIEGSDSTIGEAGHSYNGDTIIGSTNADSLFGLAGNDLILGNAGDDILVGGAGADQLFGGADTDTASYISASSGVSVTLHLDTSTGEVNGTGSLGDANGDKLFSIEKLEGSGFGDTFIGGNEADVFMGLDGNDHLVGNGGNDILEGGAGADVLDGGAGVDVVTYAHAPGPVTLNLATGGTGGDAQGDSYIAIEDVEGSTAAAGDDITGDDNANIIDGLAGDDRLHGAGGNDLLLGSDGKDKLFGDAGDDTMIGGADADAYDGGDGNDTVNYSGLAVAVAINLAANSAHGKDAAGNTVASDADGDTFNSVEIIYGTDLAGVGDSLVGNGGNNTFYGLDGADFISGAGGQDTLYGGAGNDTLHGDGGNDTLQGDEGNDTLDGGANSDVLVSGAGDDTLIGGGGTDTASYEADPAGVIVNLGAAAVTHLYDVTHASLTVAAGKAADGFGGTDSLSGITIVQGSAHNDALYAAATGSQLFGNGGNDDLFGDARTDIIHGNGGNDTIDGGGGADTLFGDDGVDHITGGAGNDTLLGGAGADTLDGGTGTNTVSYEEDTAGVIVNLDTVAHTFNGHTVAAGRALDGSGATDILSNLQNATGTSSNDALFGNDGVNVLTGGAGDDSLDGRGGVDTLIGGSGDDHYYVDDAADDVWDAGDGPGNGNDTVIASVDYSLDDSVNDSSAHRADIENLQLVGAARIGTGNALDNTITGNDLGDTISGGAGKDTITTGAGNDTIDGGTGSDTMMGGAGDDTYVIDTPDDSLASDFGIGDRVVELPNGGVDTLLIKTANFFALDTIDLTVDWAVNIENVTLLDHVEDGSGPDGFEGAGLNVKGNDLDNYIIDNAGKNTIDTGLGNDTVELTGGNPDIVHLGDGLDTLFINYAGDTTAFGISFNAPAADGYSGFFSDNTNGGDFDGAEMFHIVTGSANDTITTGDYSDTISSGAGDDSIASGAGSDTTGLDVIDGGDGIDGWGADKSTATQAIHLDLVHNTYAGPGSVTNIEYIGNSGLQTGSGDDVIVTEAINKNETISTGDGNDTVTVAGGNDNVSMEDGVDTLIVDFSADTHDVRTPNFFINDVDDDSNAITWGGTFGDGQFGGDQVNFDGVEKFNVATGSGNDTIQTGDNDDVISTGAGDDTIKPGEGVNIVDGGAGDDTVDISNWFSSAWTSIANADGSWSFTKFGVTSTFRNVEHVEFFDKTVDLPASPIAALVVLATHDYSGESLSPVGIVDFNTTEDAIAAFNSSQFSASAISPNSFVVSDLHVDTITVTLDATSFSAAGLSFLNWKASDVFTITGSSAGDVIVGSFQDDIIDGGSGGDKLTGGAGDDVLTGGRGKDVVDGGDGIDTALYTDKTTAVVVTLNGATDASVQVGGVAEDTIRNVENVTGGSGNDTLTGDGLANTLTGGTGDDTLDGGAGADTMVGGVGNDTYVVDNVADVVTENAGEGTDLVQSSITYTLGDTLENLTLTGSADLKGTGNDGDNIITGNDGDNVLIGLGGADTLDGGAGIDTVRYDGSAAGVNVSLATGLGSGGEAEGDHLLNIENIIGSSSDDTLEGDGGDNLLKGGAGVDTVSYAHAAAGVTVSLAVTVAQNTIGAGTDTLSSFDNLAGSSHNDTLTGTDAANVLSGDAGNDTLNGGGGNDTLDGGAGRDKMAGGVGNDTYVVDSTRDVVTENAGEGTADLVQSSINYTLGAEVENLTLTGAANRTATGNAGNNIITGNSGDNLLSGLGGADKLDGGDGTDTATYAASAVGVIVSLASGRGSGGDAQGDRLTHIENLTGSASDDVLKGDGGDNVLTGLAGADTFDGGDGVDTVTYTGSAAVNVSLATGLGSGGDAQGDHLSAIENVTGSSFDDTLEGNSGNNVLAAGAGVDTASYAHAAAAVTVSLALTAAQDTIGAGNDTLSGFENLTGSSHDDTLTGSNSANVLSGGAGNDTLNGGAGADTLDGGAGADTMAGGTSSDTYIVDNVGDVVTENSGEGAADLVKSSVTYTLSDNVEKLTLTGSGGIAGMGNGLANVITGNAGNNTLIGLGGSDTLKGGAGIDTADYSASAVGVNVSLATGLGSGGDAQGDHLSAIENVTGSSFDDTLEGNSGNNVLAAGAGVDTASYAHAAAAVTVSLALTAAQDTIGAGSDTLSGFENLTGSSHDDTLTGSNAANVLSGGAGDDTLDGGRGTDTLDGGAGADTMAGGTSSDTYIVDNVGDVVTENSGEGAADLVQSSITYTLGDNVENLTLTGSGRTTGTGNGLANVITGNAGNNTLTGLGGADTLDGGDGIDTADYSASAVGVNVSLATGLGSGGDAQGDHLSAIENVTGSSSNDTLEGDGGDNVLAAGVGVDTASYANAAAGVTVSLALTAAQDTIGAGTDTLSGFENLTGSSHGDMLTGSGAANVLDGGEGFDTLNGGLGADTLIGGSGDDTLNAGTGNDTLVGGAGADTLFGDAGGDKFKFNTAAESSHTVYDTILDFAGGDASGHDFVALQNSLGLTTVDGSIAGSTIASHHVGWKEVGAETIVYANTSGSAETLGSTNMEIHLNGTGLGLTVHDFLLHA